MKKQEKRVSWNLLSALVALLTVLAVLLAPWGGDDGGEQPASTTTVTTSASPPAVAVDGPDADSKRDDALPLSEGAQNVLEGAAAAPEQAVPPGDLRTDSLREPLDSGPVGVLDGPLAAQEFDGCRTRFVRNYSSRNGSAVKVIVWHYTVSTERGQASQDGLTAYANNPRNGVSWHFLIGRSNGLCTFTVPLTMKAWTQGNANPFSIGIEVEARGNEGAYVTGDGERKLFAVTRKLGARYGIPMRRGLVKNCSPVRSGIVAHADLGACGGGHHDIGPFKIQPAIDKLAASGAVTGTDRVTCRKLNWWRDAGQPKGKPERNAVNRRKALAKRGVTCTAKGPVSS